MAVLGGGGGRDTGLLITRSGMGGHQLKGRGPNTVKLSNRTAIRQRESLPPPPRVRLWG